MSRKDFQHITIAGSGKMGSDLFHFLCRYHFRITWLCISEDEAARANLQFEKRLGRQVRTGILQQEDASALKQRIRITAEMAEARDADLVIEAIWEDVRVKQEFFSALSLLVNKDTILTSNTSSVPPGIIFPPGSEQERCLGMHFFFPVMIKNFVEINAMPCTDDEVLEKLVSFLQLIEKKSIVLQTADHFALNRMLIPLQTEAVKLLRDEKATPAVIDAVVKARLFPAGVFAFFDLVGIPVMLNSVCNYRNFLTADTDSGILTEYLEKCHSPHHPVPVPDEYYSLQHLSPQVIEEIAMRLETSFYRGISVFLNKDTISSALLQEALNDYLGTDLPFVTMAREKGF